jgi:uncharacterized membrane protein YcfT
MGRMLAGSARVEDRSCGVASLQARVDWVDYGKGFCIVFVVMMHSTLGVEAALGHEGWMHYLVAFAKPFRMPDFFLISGLFLARVIDRDWHSYLDRKVVHFAYFYLLWFAIQFAFKAPGIIAEQGLRAGVELFFLSLIEPFGTLWFIYLLPIFFVVTKLARNVPPLLIWVAAAALEIAPIETGWILVDEFASRFVYFYTGYVLARPIFAFAANAQRFPVAAIAALGGWAIFNGVLVFSGKADLPFVSLALGLLGVGMVVSLCALLAKGDRLPALRYCGRNSLVIYLAFFLPMAVSRTLFIKSGVIPDIGTIALLVTIAGVAGPLVLYWAVRGTRLRFLFERPARFRLAAKPTTSVLQPAE